MKSQRERADERRQEKLDDLERQIENGTLEVRQMTDEERARHPMPSPEDIERRRRRRPHRS